MKVIGFAICLNNEDYAFSLELHKIYPVVAPYDNDPEEYVRIIDESRKDYLFPSTWFEPVSLGTKLEARLLESVVV